MRDRGGFVKSFARALMGVGAAAILCVFSVQDVWSQLGPEDAGEKVVLPVVKPAEWGSNEFAGDIASGSVVSMSGGRRAVLVQARDKIELWALGEEARIADTGHVRWLGDGRRTRVEWERGKREDFTVGKKGDWPWRPTGDRFGAFLLSDWLIAEGGAVGLPFLGGESVGFSLQKDGEAEARAKDGRRIGGNWWWSGGRLHLRLDGFDEVATYEWAALARHVGWSQEKRAPEVLEPVKRSARAPGPPVPVEARSEVPSSRAVCKRDVLGALLRTASERSDVVSALGIEQQVLIACRDRQKLVVEIVEAEQRLAEVLEKKKGQETAAPAEPVSVKTVAQLVEVAAGEAVVARRPETAGVPAKPAAAGESPRAPSSEADGKPRPGAWSWFSLLGREGKLLAGVTDGSGAWFVSEGEKVPGAGTVRRISARPPGVEIAGVGMLRWAERPPAGRSGKTGSRQTGQPRPEAFADDALERVVDTVLGRGAVGSRGGSGLKGRADAVDGDTLRMGDVRVRLWGIDAPERKQSCVAEGLEWDCGLLAMAALRSRATDVTCREKGRDGYGRVLAVCFERGDDVNAWMVSEGWALAYRRFSEDYVSQEETAKAARKGIHRGRFVAPWDWRRGDRLSGADPGAGEKAAGAGSARADELPPLPGREN